MEQINEPHAFESDLSGVRYVPRLPVRTSLLQSVVGLNRCRHPQQAASVSRRHAEKTAQHNSARNAAHLFGGHAADSPGLKANPEHAVRRATSLTKPRRMPLQGAAGLGPGSAVFIDRPLVS